MTNSYQPRDLDIEPQYQPPPHPVAAAKGRLQGALQESIEEAQSLANYYDNLVKQLTLMATEEKNK